MPSESLRQSFAAQVWALFPPHLSPTSPKPPRVERLWVLRKAAPGLEEPRRGWRPSGTCATWLGRWGRSAPALNTKPGGTDDAVVRNHARNMKRGSRATCACAGPSPACAGMLAAASQFSTERKLQPAPATGGCDQEGDLEDRGLRRSWHTHGATSAWEAATKCGRRDILQRATTRCSHPPEPISP